MKFKYLITVFGVIVVVFLFIMVLLPVLLMGPEAAANFRSITWPVSLLMVVALAVLAVFSVFNYRFLSLLEREDWPALAYYLEHRIYVKGRYSSRNVRLLAGSYLVMSDYPSMLRLEGKALSVRPAVVEENALTFGAARLLNGKYGEAVAFFKTYLEKGRETSLHKRNVKDEQWVRMFYGFSQMLAGGFGKAEAEFTSLAASSPDALITGLSSYFLFNNLAKYSLKPAECRTAAENGRERVVKVLKTAKGWKREMEKMDAEIHVSIIRRYINETGIWLGLS